MGTDPTAVRYGRHSRELKGVHDQRRPEGNRAPRGSRSRRTHVAAGEDLEDRHFYPDVSLVQAGTRRPTRPRGRCSQRETVTPTATQTQKPPPHPPHPPQQRTQRHSPSSPQSPPRPCSSSPPVACSHTFPQDALTNVFNDDLRLSTALPGSRSAAMPARRFRGHDLNAHDCRDDASATT